MKQIDDRIGCQMQDVTFGPLNRERHSLKSDVAGANSKVWLSPLPASPLTRGAPRHAWRPPPT